MRPRIVSKFLKMKPDVQISHVAACRSRSVAVSNDSGDVYEWGYLGNDRGAESQFEVSLTLPSKLKHVEAGLNFNLYLMEDGKVFVSGEIYQDGETIMNTFNYGDGKKLVNLTDSLPDDVNIVSIKCGYSHALLLDD